MPNDYVCIDGIRFPIGREMLEKVKALVCPKPPVRVGDVLQLNSPGPGINPLRLVVRHSTPGFLQAIDQNGRFCNYGLPHSPVWGSYTHVYNVFTGVDSQKGDYC